MKMKGARTTLLVVGLLLACASESSGALGLVVALMCLVSFALLIVLSPAGREEGDDEAVATFTTFPHPSAIHRTSERITATGGEDALSRAHAPASVARGACSLEK